MLAGCLLALACEPTSGRDADPGEATPGVAGVGDEASSGQILPEAPWFELPDDWTTQHPTLSPNAQLEVHLRALAERQLPANPADSAGHVSLESVSAVTGGAGQMGEAPPPKTGAGSGSGERPRLPAASRQRFVIRVEVGEPGIVDGGALFVLADPFWLWSEVQTSDPEAPGYTTATLVASPASESSSNPVRLVPSKPTGGFRVEGRALEAGEGIEIVYGAGPAGAVVDRYAERGAEIRIGLDADGDGRRAWLSETVAVDITPGEPRELVAFGPAEVEPGGRFEINLALLDSVGNHAPWPAATLAGDGSSRVGFEILTLPAATLSPASGSGPRESVAATDSPHRAALVAPRLSPGAVGTLRLRVRGLGPLEPFTADLPPIVVREGPTHLVWADLHGHSRYSDGSGSPDDYFRYARDVARLDAIALTDHDHWGIDPLDERPDRQAEILALAKTYHVPGRFVTLPGYEWTSWLHGHRHVLSFDDELPLLSSIDPATDRPDELWAALRGRPALTFAHHSAGDPVATNWNFAPDPVLEPVTEIASVHGMSEAADAPAPIGGAVEGNFVRDVLLHGARLGFIGSGDSHDGHPGLAQIASGQSGLAGLFVEDLDRPGLLAALQQRRSLATNGIRAWLDVSIDGIGMGGVLPSSGGAEHVLRIRFEATAPVARVDLVRSGRVASIDPAKLAGEAAPEHGPRGPLSLDLERRIPRLAPGEFHYVRILQADGGVAWSSPIFVAASPTATPTVRPEP